mgnify:CR=1 FL=1
MSFQYNIAFAERLISKTGNFQLEETKLCNGCAIQLYSVVLPVSSKGIPVPRNETA